MRAPVLAESVLVRRPPAHLYALLGESANARKWSVFVHHITQTNAGKVPDGAVGSRRRCFVREDETGARWDEELVECVQAKKRRITIFDLVGFKMGAERLLTEQIYEEAVPGATVLTFTLTFLDRRAPLADVLRFLLAAPLVRSVFRRNLANIRALAETGDRYQRAFPFKGGTPGLVEGASWP